MAASERCHVTTDDRPPARIGTLVRRTIAAYTGGFPSLYAIVAVVLLPVALVQSFVPVDLTAIDDVRKILALPRGDTAGVERLLRHLGAHAPNGWASLASVVAFVAVPLSRTAAFIGGAELLAQRSPSLVATYRAAFVRWLPQIVTQLAFMAVVFAGALAASLTFVLAAALIALAAFASRLVALALSVILAFAFLATAVSVAAFAYLTWQLAAACVATVEPNPVRAIGTTVRRVLTRAVRGQTLRIGLGLAAFECAAGLLLLLVAILAASTRVAVLPALAVGACAVVVEGLRALFVLAYAGELRAEAAVTP